MQESVTMATKSRKVPTTRGARDLNKSIMKGLVSSSGNGSSKEGGNKYDAQKSKSK